MSEDRTYFKSKGPSAFIKITRDELTNAANSNWEIGGESSLTLKHSPTMDTIEFKFGKGLVPQIWLERPNKGNARCKFEVANKIPSLNEAENKQLREKIASSLRSYMIINGLPKEFENATGSTVIATRIELSRIKTIEDDINLNIDRNEIQKILNFYKFLDEKLIEWNKKELVNFL